MKAVKNVGILILFPKTLQKARRYLKSSQPQAELIITGQKKQFIVCWLVFG
jgi:hypothetical protein